MDGHDPKCATFRALPSTLPVSLVVYLILLVLLIFYLRHYFFLENTVQHWYHIAEELHDRAEEAR